MQLKIRYILSLTLGLFLTSTFAQTETVNFVNVDTASYNAYLKKDWKKVIRISKLAIDNNIDYYYLRMRAGIAYYEKAKYSHAIMHFKKALEFNSSDTIAEKYVYYAYQWQADDIRAMDWLSGLSSDWAKKELRSKSLVNDIYAFYAKRIYKTDVLDSAAFKTVMPEIEKTGEPHYTQQSIYQSYSNLQIGGTLRLSPKWRLGISFQNFSLSSYQTVVDPFRFEGNENNIKQNQWNINNTFALGDSFTGFVYGSYLSFRFDNINVNTETVPLQYNLATNVEDKDWLAGVGLEYHHNYFDIGLKAQYMSHSLDAVLQSDVILKFYPLGTPKMYTQTQISIVKQGAENRQVYKQSINFKPIKRLDLGIAAYWGNLSLWSDRNAYAVYNGNDDIRMISQINCTVNLYKGLYLKMYYENIKSDNSVYTKSLLPTKTDNQEYIIQIQQYITHSIIGGLIWAF
jgi:tetratricopeptide (TPR) repeat protein